MTIKLTGLDQMQNKLEQLRKNAQSIDGTNEVPMNELMPDSFMRQFTEFSSLQAMVDAAGIDDPQELNEQPWSNFVAAHSQFTNWEQMQQKAGEQWIAHKLGF